MSSGPTCPKSCRHDICQPGLNSLVSSLFLVFVLLLLLLGLQLLSRQDRLHRSTMMLLDLLSACGCCQMTVSCPANHCEKAEHAVADIAMSRVPVCQGWRVLQKHGQITRMMRPCQLTAACMSSGRLWQAATPLQHLPCVGVKIRQS